MPPESAFTGPAGPLPRQIAVYRKYLLLQAIAAENFDRSLAGRLVACIGFGLDGAELAIAAAIAGGGFLSIDPDQRLLKAALRNGSCDFMVNTLDEALRVLKNELRRKQPLAAGLLGRPSDILREMLDRGVQPDVVDNLPALDSAANDASSISSVGANKSFDATWKPFLARGSVGLNGPENPLAPNDKDRMKVEWSATTPQDMDRMDRIALSSLPEGDWVRRRWLEHAAGRFYRQTPLERVLFIRPDELSPLIRAFTDSRPSQGPATVRWRSPNGEEQSITVQA